MTGSPRLDVAGIASRYEERAGGRYGGEAVTQLAHALQCAALARGAGDPDALVLACLLHDIGHLWEPEDADPEAPDAGHELRAAALLAGAFPEDVVAPIRLHVAAKRFLCHADPDYHDSLSPASQRSLQRQGGPFTADEARVFMAQPFCQDALRLRRHDDLAKEPGATVPRFAEYLPMLRAHAIGG